MTHIPGERDRVSIDGSWDNVGVTGGLSLDGKEAQ